MELDLNKKYPVVYEDLSTKEMSLKDILSKNDKTLIFFYPKDNTPGCSVENSDFTKYREDFFAKGVGLFGASKDSPQSHEAFIEKKGLKNPLISDFGLDLHKELGTYGEKNNYGKIVMGVIRSTFLLDKKGNILKEWRNIRAKGHVERILKEI